MSGNNLDKLSAKILVLGDSGVGKSSLIHLICHSRILNSAQWTIGCSIDVKLYENYFLEFWDIGGSRSHKIARSFLYNNYHGIMLVFDATNNKSKSNLNEWLNEVDQTTRHEDLKSSNRPKIYIATKKDLLPLGTILESPSSVVAGNDSSSHQKSGRTTYCDEGSNVANLLSNEDSNPLLQQAHHQYQHQQSFNSPPYNNRYGLYRRHQASSSFTSSQSMPTNLQTSYSNSSQNLSFSPLNSMLPNPNSYPGNNNYGAPDQEDVIYVNTQDVLSFSSDSRNYEKLDHFFKCATNERVRKV